MKTRTRFVIRSIVPAVVFVLAALHAGPSSADDLTIFGPRQYDVLARYGADNRSRENLQATPGPYLLKIRNGSQSSSRPELVYLSVNGAPLINAEQFGYPAIVCLLSLGRENEIALNLRDQKPPGLTRPLLPPRSLVLAVERSSRVFPEGVYGLRNWDALDELIGSVRAMQSSESRELAVRAVDLRQPAEARAKALRALGARKDRFAREYLLARYRDIWAQPVVRAEAAVALGTLGDVQLVPALMDGLSLPNDTVRHAAARALSLYPEDAVRSELALRLDRLDPLMRSAVLRSIADSGWQPIRLIGDLAGSPDRHLALIAIELLGHMRDKRSTDLLLARLQTADDQELSAVIQALGISKDVRAVGPLTTLAQDPARRKGHEVALGTALAALGDRQAESSIRALADAVDAASDYLALADAYRTLMGKELVREQK